MTYDEIRQHVQEHFRELLASFKRGIASDGPPDAHRLNALRATEGLAGGDPETWRAATYPADDVALLSDFCARRDIALADLTEANRGWLLDTLQAGHASMASEALNYVSSLGHFDMADATQKPSTTAPQMLHAMPTPATSKSVAEVAAIYFDEIKRTAPVEPKTELDRKEVLELLDEITGHKPITAITKRDAQEVKRVLLRLPWNRNKMAATRGKTLADMLALEGVRVISTRRVTTHLGNLRAFFNWAAANGHAEVNVFDGMQVKAAKTTRDELRDAFNVQQLQVMFRHLTDNPDGLVRQDVHKWGTLIAMFSGMRVNEVAQLDTADIKQFGEVWYFDVTKGDDARKSLKNEASQRRLPIHKRLIECGLLDYIAAQRDAGHKRLFHELSYSETNHYGRNLGRWVKGSFLTALGIKSKVLTFHSFRHTMATRLAQVDAPERHVPAILGHRQAGMTYSTYLKDGYLPAQLKVTIDLYDF